MTDERKVTSSSGNVFADLDVENAEAARLKAELAHRIASIIKHRHLTQAQAAEILAVDQPKVSALVRGRLYGFSAERLMEFLTALGRDVEISVKKRGLASEPGRLRVRA